MAITNQPTTPNKAPKGVKYAYVSSSGAPREAAEAKLDPIQALSQQVSPIFGLNFRIIGLADTANFEVEMCKAGQSPRIATTSIFIATKYRHSNIKASRIEQALLFVLTKKEFSSYIFSIGRYTFNLFSFPKTVIKAIINHLFDNRVGLAWIAPLQDLVLDIAKPKKVKEKRQKSKTLSAKLKNHKVSLSFKSSGISTGRATISKKEVLPCWIDMATGNARLQEEHLKGLITGDIPQSGTISVTSTTAVSSHPYAEQEAKFWYDNEINKALERASEPPKQ